MKPALSVVLFTVLSGAGLGALSVLGVADLAARIVGSPPPSAANMTAAIALMLVIAGLGASTAHLANPRNAWRALTRWRSSWLSREALVAACLVPIAVAYVAMRDGGVLHDALAAVLVLLAWTMLYCTAMIYASLVPVRQWHTRRVPLAFWLLAHASGALLVVSIAPAGDAWISATLALFVLALTVKLEYWQFVGRTDGGVTLAHAIGVDQGVGPGGPRGGATVAAARLLDAGHSKGTFLTREFMHPFDNVSRRALRAIALVAGFAIPALWLVAGRSDWRLGVAAFVACLGGFCAERWLFFAEARHTVRLYHGEATTAVLSNHHRRRPNRY